MSTNRDYLQPVSDQSDSDVDLIQPDLAFSDLPSQMWSAPTELPDELRNLHASLVDSLRRDAQHLPTGTLGAMQVERVAYFYVRLRYHETSNNWPNPKYREHLYKLYRDSANDLTAAAHSTKISPDSLHQIVSSHTAKVVASVLGTLPREQASPLYRKFANALEQNDTA